MRFGLTHVCLVAVTWMALVLAVTAGCDRKADNPPPQSQPQQPKTPTTLLVPVTQIIDWCKEHGVPESVCAQCNTSLAEGFKAKGDWCKQHDVPQSQCFKCSPELKEKFVAAFKQKYGKEPPAASEDAK